MAGCSCPFADNAYWGRRCKTACVQSCSIPLSAARGGFGEDATQCFSRGATQKQQVAAASLRCFRSECHGWLDSWRCNTHGQSASGVTHRQRSRRGEVSDAKGRAAIYRSSVAASGVFRNVIVSHVMQESRATREYETGQRCPWRGHGCAPYWDARLLRAQVAAVDECISLAHTLHIRIACYIITLANSLADEPP